MTAQPGAAHMPHHTQTAGWLLAIVPDEFVESTQVVMRDFLEGTDRGKLFDTDRRISPDLLKARCARGHSPNFDYTFLVQPFKKPGIEKHSVGQQRR